MQKQFFVMMVWFFALNVMQNLNATTKPAICPISAPAAVLSLIGAISSRVDASPSNHLVPVPRRGFLCYTFINEFSIFRARN